MTGCGRPYDKNPSPTSFARAYLRNPEEAVTDYSLSIDEDSVETWYEVMVDISGDVEIVGHEYVTTFVSKRDVTDKRDVYILKFRKGGENDYVLIVAHRAKEGKFSPGAFYYYEFTEPVVKERIEEWTGRRLRTEFGR